MTHLAPRFRAHLGLELDLPRFLLAARMRTLLQMPPVTPIADPDRPLSGSLLSDIVELDREGTALARGGAHATESTAAERARFGGRVSPKEDRV